MNYSCRLPVQVSVEIKVTNSDPGSVMIIVLYWLFIHQKYSVEMTLIFLWCVLGHFSAKNICKSKPLWETHSLLYVTMIRCRHKEYAMHKNKHAVIYGNELCASYHGIRLAAGYVYVNMWLTAHWLPVV